MDTLRYRAAAKALGTNANGLIGAVFGRDTHALKVGTELTAGDSGHLGTNPLKALGTPAGRHLIANLAPFSTNLTNPRHCSIPCDIPEILDVWSSGLSGRL